MWYPEVKGDNTPLLDSGGKDKFKIILPLGHAEVVCAGATPQPLQPAMQSRLLCFHVGSSTEVSAQRERRSMTGGEGQAQMAQWAHLSWPWGQEHVHQAETWGSSWDIAGKESEEEHVKYLRQRLGFLTLRAGGRIKIKRRRQKICGKED